MRRVVSAFRPYRPQVLLVGLAILVTSGLGVVNPLMIAAVFDNALFGNTQRRRRPCAGQPCPNLPLLYVYVGLMVAVPIVTGVIGVGQTYLSNLVGLRVMQDLRNSLYSHLQSMPLRFFTKTRTGEIQSRLANDVGGVQAVVTDTASNVLSNIVVIISTLIAMLVLSVPSTILSLFITPLFVWLTVKVGRARREVAGNTQRTLADLTAITEETLSVSGILLSKSFGRQRHEIGRFQDENQRLTGLQIRQTMIGRSFFAIVGTFFSITPALVYLVTGWVNSGGNAEPIKFGVLVAFTTLQSRLFFPIGSMLQVSTDVQSSWRCSTGCSNTSTWSTRSRTRPTPEHSPTTRSRAMCRSTRCGSATSRTTRVGTQAAPTSPPSDREPDGRHRSRSTASGRWRASTSTSLPDSSRPSSVPAERERRRSPTSFRACTTCSEGRCAIDDIDVRDHQAGIARRDHRDGHPGDLPVPHHDPAQPAVRATGRHGGADDRRRQGCVHPRSDLRAREGYDTVVGERGYKLSGGEKQRLAIARVILKDPRDPDPRRGDVSLDTTSERLVQEALRPLMRDRTTIAIAHRLSTILSADVIFVVDRGRIVERGTHENSWHVRACTRASTSSSSEAASSRRSARTG